MAYMEFDRESMHEHAHAAARAVESKDLDRSGRLARAAASLPPLQSVQTALDQLVSRSDTVQRGSWDPALGTFNSYSAAALAHAREHRDILRIAADAAAAMIDRTEATIRKLRSNMAHDRAHDDAPKLTVDGSPHPLQQGGYDPNSDPQLPGNISDVEALKEGKMTHKQAEAIAKADVANMPKQEDSTAPDVRRDDKAVNPPAPKKDRK